MPHISARAAERSERTARRKVPTAEPTKATAAEPVGSYGELDRFVGAVARATPYQLVEFERHGVGGRLLKDFSRRLDIPQMRIFEMIGVPKATAEKKVASDGQLSGSGGQSAVGLARLLAKAQDMVSRSTAREARDFDAAKWLGHWLQLPQPALGGRKPCDLLDTPSGLAVVLKLLGSLESGAYQ